MKYFFLAYLAVALLVVGIGGFRGDKFSRAPIEVFPDMDNQDKLKGQKPDGFFADGMGSRLPVMGTVPRNADSGLLPIEFGAGRSGYYFTGALGDKYGNGMPKELKLAAKEDSAALLSRGREMYDVNCAICHGESGNGKGVINQFEGQMKGNIANLLGEPFQQATAPDGYIFEVISNGKGLMGGYKHNLPVRDRWAIVAYLRSLQASAK
ncbi:cytochrome c [Akkermansiaceae bacterium]|nr:cytochrome c [Akkermansiaceae bacterium]MDB4537180.1 cytochrome c [Akkermansiaceae bacterium]